MNKKFLSAVLFGALIAGSSVTFTGCVDNDEPAGIENLRGAKAELLRAKVAVEQAEAARLSAEAARIQAVAEVEKVNAAYRNAEAALQQALADQEAARTEEEKARIEMQIAQYKLDMEEAVQKHQTTMIKLQTKYAEAKRHYELLLKEIEIAETLVRGEEATELAVLKAEVEKAYNAIYEDGTGWLDKVYDAEKALYEAQLNKMNGNDAETDWIPELEWKVSIAEEDLAAAKNSVQTLKDFLAKDANTTDWRKEIATLEDSVKVLEKAKEGYEIELIKIQKSDDYIAAQGAVDAAQKALDEIKASAYSYEFLFDGSNGYGLPKFEVKDNMAAADAKKEINNEIKAVKAELASYTTEKIAALEEFKKDQVATIAGAKKAYDEAVADWQAAKAKYDLGGMDVAKYKTDVLGKVVKDQIAIIQDAQVIYNSTDPLVTDAMKNAARNRALAAESAMAKALVDFASEVKRLGSCEDVKTKLDYVVVEGGLPVTKNDKEQTIVAWLSDAANVGYNLEQLAAVSKAEQLTEANVMGIEVIKNIKASKAELLTVLEDKSDVAFGKELLVDLTYMRAEPTAAEVRAIENYATKCGAAGNFHYVTDPATIEEAENYKDIMADYEAAIKSMTEKVAAIDESIDAAKKVLAEKKDAFKVFTDKEKAVVAKLKAVQTSWNYADAVKTQLIMAVNKHLGLDGIGFADTEKFEEALKEAVKKAEEKVFTAEKDLSEAQVNLKKAQEGKYDAVAAAQRDLDKANAGLEKAQKEYEEALNNLNIALEIMAKTADAE